MSGIDRPKFLLFIADQHRAELPRLYGRPVVRTPSIDFVTARDHALGQIPRFGARQHAELGERDGGPHADRPNRHKPQRRVSRRIPQRRTETRFNRSGPCPGPDQQGMANDSACWRSPRETCHLATDLGETRDLRSVRDHATVCATLTERLAHRLARQMGKGPRDIIAA